MLHKCILSHFSISWPLWRTRKTKQRPRVSFCFESSANIDKCII